jgi:hypothetical protein
MIQQIATGSSHASIRFSSTITVIMKSEEAILFVHHGEGDPK